MRVTLSAVLGLLAIGLAIGSITLNWPASPSEWTADSYDVGWGRYALAMAFAIMAMLTLFWPDILRTYRVLKRRGGGDGHQRLINQGIGRRESKERNNPWPKKVP